jgi:hypothetical protein
VANAGSAQKALSVLRLSDSVDDTAWPSERTGALYAGGSRVAELSGGSTPEACAPRGDRLLSRGARGNRRP